MLGLGLGLSGLDYITGYCCCICVERSSCYQTTELVV